jgi:hypothetical protein
MEARRTGTHQVLQCHSAHRYTIKDLVTNEETVEHASYLEYFDDEIASTKDAMRSQVAHDTYGFKVSGIGKHEQRQGRWHLLPPGKKLQATATQHQQR